MAVKISRGIPIAQSIPWGGSGRIHGIVKAGSAPWRRKVCLFNVRNRKLILETWSDPVTGAYSFDNIDPSLTYFVVAFDHTGAYNAVIADQVTTEPMP